MADAAVPLVPGYGELTRIGRGGFSIVYRGVQETLGRDVAIKVLQTDLTEEVDVRRFTAECQILGRLGAHRNIVDVYDARVTDDGHPYIVMKYYDQGTLADRVATAGPLRVEEVIDIGVKISGALQAAHDIGVIHRDIKPENILLDEMGQPVLTDFGVATIADADGSFTKSVAFSPAHVAPEVLDRNEFGPASDIYGLGSTLYTLLAGVNAFTAQTEARQIMAIMQEPPPPLMRADVPEELRAVISIALEKDPSQRFASASAMARALQGVVVSPADQHTIKRPPVREVPLATQIQSGQTAQPPIAAEPTLQRTTAIPPAAALTQAQVPHAQPQPAGGANRGLVIAIIAGAVILAVAIGGLAMAMLGKNSSVAASTGGASSNLSGDGTTVAQQAPAAVAQQPVQQPAAVQPVAFGSLTEGSVWRGLLISDPYGQNNQQDTLDARMDFTSVASDGQLQATVHWTSQKSAAFGTYVATGQIVGDQVSLQGQHWVAKSNAAFTLDSYQLTLNGDALSGRYTGAKYSPNDITKRGDAGSADLTLSN